MRYIMHKITLLLLLTALACTQKKIDSSIDKPIEDSGENIEYVSYINNIPMDTSGYEFYSRNFYDIISRSENFYKNNPDIVAISKYIMQGKYTFIYNDVFTELYLYNIHTTNMDRMRDLQQVRVKIRTESDFRITLDDSFGVVGAIPFFITNAVLSTDFPKEFADFIVENDFLISVSIIDSVLSYWISQQDVDSFIKWVEFFERYFNFKPFVKHNETRIVDSSDSWETPNFITAALIYPPVREYLYKNGYINTSRERLYSSLIHSANNTYGDEVIARIKDLIIAYPESINLIGNDGLPLFYRYKDDVQFITFLEGQNLTLPDTGIEYQERINELISELSRYGDYDSPVKSVEYWKSLINPITNINEAQYKGTNYDRRNSTILRAVFAYNDISDIVDSVFIDLLLEKGLEIKASYDLLENLIDRQESILEEYLSIFPLPEYTEVPYLGMHGHIEIKKYLTNEPYDYYITTALHQYKIEDLKVLLEHGYINNNDKEKYLQYAIDNELQTALVLANTNDIRVQVLIARKEIYQAISSNDYDEFVKIAKIYDINSHYGIVNSIFSGGYYNSPITANKIKMLQYLDDNGYDFGMTNESGRTQFNSVLNDDGPTGWDGETLLRDYIRAKLPLPDHLLRAEVYLSDDLEKSLTEPNSVLVHFLAKNNKGEMLNLIQEQGYIDFSKAYVAQELLRSIQHGADQSAQFFIDNGVDLTATNEEGENAIDLAWQLPLSPEGPTYYDNQPYGNYEKTRTLILETYKAKFLEIFPQYSNIFNYELAPNKKYPKGIQNIQYNLAKKDKNISVFHPLNFRKNQYTLFNQNINQDTPSELLLSYGSCTEEYESDSYELFVFLSTNGADINRIIPETEDNLLMYTGLASNLSNFVFLLNQENIDLSYTNQYGNTFLHELAQDYAEDMGWNNYSIIDRVSVLPVDRVDVNATNNSGYTFYWLLNARRMFSPDTTLQMVLEILKIDTNIGKTTDSAGMAVG